MFTVNKDYLSLRGSYLFAEISGKVNEYKAENPGREIISLGIGDVTRPLTPAVINALHEAVESQKTPEGFKGYAPDLGYDFLRKAIAENDYLRYGCDIESDEIFVSDGAKSDSGNIQEIFGRDNIIAVCDPVYPVYVDSNVMAGRTGSFDESTGKWSDIIYLPCTAENGFSPGLPSKTPDIIYICSPNNPTGTAMNREELQKWVDYANENHSVIIYDAAYEAYITEKDIPHSIYECRGAKNAAIEIRSFSKNAGFTGVRLGFTVVPKALKSADGIYLYDLWKRRHGTKFNGAPYIQQRAGYAVYSKEGQKEIRENVAYYMENARLIREGLVKMGYEVYGGINAPYIWLKTPDAMTSWEFFEKLLKNANVVGTPGSGIGPSGEHYFRLTAFGKHDDTKEALRRIGKM